jgi:hypothetical protein
VPSPSLMSESCIRKDLLIHFSSMADNQDKDGQDIVFDLVDDAIVSDSYAVTGPAFEFFIAEGPWIVSQVF